MAKAKTSITTENRSGSAADAVAKEKRTEMPLSDLHPFEGHPFKVLDDELMEQTVESIKQIGVVSPLIVRPDPEGGFEILSGHRRLHAAQLAGLETVPVIVKEMDDDAAIIFMVDSNLQRENILPSERAFSYKMKLEAMKHQGQRKDLTSEQFAPKLSTEIIGEAVGMSKDTVKRYIRLTNLIPEILDMVDEKKIAFNPAVELSYLKPSEQKEFLEAMDYAQASPSLSQAQRLKKLSQEGGCTLDAMCEVMNEIKKDELDHVTIKNEVLRKYFPKSYTPKQMQDTIKQRLSERRFRPGGESCLLHSQVQAISAAGYFLRSLAGAHVGSMAQNRSLESHRLIGRTSYRRTNLWRFLLQLHRHCLFSHSCLCFCPGWRSCSACSRKEGGGSCRVSLNRSQIGSRA